MKKCFIVIAVAISLTIAAPAFAFLDYEDNSINNEANATAKVINKVDVDVGICNRVSNFNMMGQYQDQDQIQGQIQGQKQDVTNSGNTAQTTGDITVEDKREFLAAPGLMDAPAPLKPEMAQTAIGRLFNSILGQKSFSKEYVDNVRNHTKMMRTKWAFKKVKSENINIGTTDKLGGSITFKTNDFKFFGDLMQALSRAMDVGASAVDLNYGIVPRSTSFGLSTGGGAAGTAINKSNPYAYAGSAGGVLGYNSSQVKMQYIVVLSLYK